MATYIWYGCARAKDGVRVTKSGLPKACYLSAQVANLARESYPGCFVHGGRAASWLVARPTWRATAPHMRIFNICPADILMLSCAVHWLYHTHQKPSGRVGRLMIDPHRPLNCSRLVVAASSMECALRLMQDNWAKAERPRCSSYVEARTLKPSSPGSQNVRWPD